MDDEDGIPLSAGDFITFSFGIPPTSVVAQLYEHKGALWVNCIWPEDVNPKREKLSRIKKWCFVWKTPAVKTPAKATP